MSNMIITNQNLTRIAKKLLEQRSLIKDKYRIVGNPLITHRRNDSFLSLLSSLSYVEYSPLDFSEVSSITISCEGNFYSSDEDKKQCFWSLSNAEYTQIISLYIENNSLNLYLNSTLIANIYTFTNIDNLKILLDLSSSNFKALITAESQKIETSGLLLHNIDISSLSYVSLGSDPLNRNNFWEGSINFSGFTVKSNNKTIYSPSDPITFNFTKLLVSDGTYELDDKSIPVLNHIYAFDVAFLQRTDNTILLSAVIDSDVYLNITEFGLYILTEDGKQLLFSSAKGYSLKKEKNVGYDLIFKIDLSLSVVNTIAMPEFIIREFLPANYEDFYNIKKTFLYIITNLERCIRENANRLGYAQELKVNQELNDININVDNFKYCYAFITLKKEGSYSNLQSIEDFYTFFEYPFSFYRLKNLNHLENKYDIKVVDNLFKGNVNSIDFESSESNSILFKVNLVNSDSKYIVGKVNFNSESIEKYFTLEYSDYKITFKYFTEDEEVSLEAVYDINTIGDIIDNPILISVTSTVIEGERNFYLYINNNLVNSTVSTSEYPLTPSDYSIANYIPQDEDTLDNSIYIQNILFFKKALNLEDIYYVGNMLGVTF